MKRSNINTLINTICISTSLICVALTLWGNFKHGGVITIESFIGVMATFTGICATIIVGFQIINLLEFFKMKQEMQDFKEQQNEIIEKTIQDFKTQQNETIENMQTTIVKKTDIIRNGVSSAFRAMYHVNQKHLLNTVIYIVSVITYTPTEDSPSTSKTLYRAYCKLDRLIEQDAKKAPSVMQALIKKYLPDIEQAEIPTWVDNRNEILRIRRRIISKIELL